MTPIEINAYFINDNKYSSIVKYEDSKSKPQQLTPEFASNYPYQATIYFNNGIVPWRIEDAQYVIDNYGIKTALVLVKAWYDRNNGPVYKASLKAILDYLKDLEEKQKSIPQPSSSHSTQRFKINVFYHDKYISWEMNESPKPKPNSLTLEFAKNYPWQSTIYFNNMLAPWRIEDCNYVLENFGIRSAYILVLGWYEWFVKNDNPALRAQLKKVLDYLKDLEDKQKSIPQPSSSHSSHPPQSSSHSSHTSNLVQLQNGNTIDLSQAPLPPKKLTLTYAKEYPGHAAYYFNQGIFCDNKENIKRAIKFSNLTTAKYLTKGLYLYLKNTNPQAAVFQKQLTEYIYALDSKKSPRKSPKKDDRRRNSSGCLVGWSRNPKTGRCWVSKKPGYERSPKTGKWLKKCDRSQTRNPKTNRCKKTPRKKSR